MPGSWKYFMRIHILIGNVFVCLITDLAVCHWQDMKNRRNGVLDVLEDSEEEIFGRGMVSGPFEDPSRDSRIWMNYIGGNRAVVKERIADVEKNLLKGAEEVGLLAGDKKDKSGGESDWYARKNWKQNVGTTRNRSGYIEDVKSKWDEPDTFQTAKEIVRNFGDEVGAGGNGRISGFLKRLRAGAIDVKTGLGNCNQTELDKQIMKEIRESLAKSFMYRNVTLSDINRMAKIVDFVDRYRGRMRGFGDAKRDKFGAVPGGAAAGSVITPPV